MSPNTNHHFVSPQSVKLCLWLLLSTKDQSFCEQDPGMFLIQLLSVVDPTSHFPSIQLVSAWTENWLDSLFGSTVYILLQLDLTADLHGVFLIKWTYLVGMRNIYLEMTEGEILWTGTLLTLIGWRWWTIEVGLLSECTGCNQSTSISHYRTRLLHQPYYFAIYNS